MCRTKHSVSRADQMTPRQFAHFSMINQKTKKLTTKLKIRQIKKLFPSNNEIKLNVRSRSAVLRIGELTDVEVFEKISI